MCGVSDFSHCDKMSDKEQLKEGLVYSGSQFKETVRCGRLGGLNENGSHSLYI